MAYVRLLSCLLKDGGLDNNKIRFAFPDLLVYWMTGNGKHGLEIR